MHTFVGVHDCAQMFVTV